MKWNQPTICDLDGDGKADAVFALADGRVFVYRTGLAYHAQRMQWPTAFGNQHRNAVWRASR
jgi:hypothetical protein